MSPRLAYARALLAVGRETDALAQYDLARKANATPALEEFERLRAAPLAPPPPREAVKLTVVPGARSAEVVSIARPVAVSDKTRFIHIAGMDDLKKSIRLQIIEPFINPGLFAKFRKKAGGGILLYGPPGCGRPCWRAQWPTSATQVSSPSASPRSFRCGRARASATWR
jgi:hypothetical protein